jgi:hypothetical protein
MKGDHMPPPTHAGVPSEESGFHFTRTNDGQWWYRRPGGRWCRSALTDRVVRTQLRDAQALVALIPSGAKKGERGARGAAAVPDKAAGSTAGQSTEAEGGESRRQADPASPEGA